ncbi:hypothetical protein E2320_010156 [Naja naja]|nr:hypothetical protein E2320_010156 [Naja naja]
MKLPSSVGQKKIKALEQMLMELGVDLNPMPTEEIVQMFNELRSDLVLLYELKQAFANCEYELQMLRHRYEALAKAGSTGPSTDGGSHPDGQPGTEEGKGDSKEQIIDVVGAPLTPNSKEYALVWEKVLTATEKAQGICLQFLICQEGEEAMISTMVQVQDLGGPSY